MRRAISVLVFLLFLAGGYTAAGMYGYHDMWVPVSMEKNKDGSNNVELRIDADQIEEKSKKLISEGKIKQAIRLLNHKLNELKGKELEKYKPTIAYMLGRGYEKMERNEQAREHYQKYLEIAPKEKGKDRKADVLYRIAMTHQKAEKREHYLRKAAFEEPRGKIGKKVASVYGTVLGEDPEPVSKLFHLSLKFIHQTKSGSEKRKSVREKIKPVADHVFTSGKPYLDAEIYEIQSGDTLSGIGSQFNVGIGWINYTNDRPLPVRGGSPRAKTIRPGRKLTIFPGPLSFDVYIGDLRLDIFYRDLLFVKSYPVGVGEGGENKTPTGTYKITSKSINPDWYHPETGEIIPFDHPKNIIGTRWMAIDLPKYGIHGIDDKKRDTIGTKSSMGCIRMYNEDAEALYDIVPTLKATLPEDHVPTVRILK